MNSRKSVAVAILAYAITLASIMYLSWVEINVFVKGDESTQGEGEVGRFLREHDEGLSGLIGHPAIRAIGVLCVGFLVGGIVLQKITVGLQTRWAERKYDLKRLVAKADKVVSGGVTLSRSELCELVADLGGEINAAAEGGTLDQDTIAAYRHRVRALFDIIEAGRTTGRKGT
jgi:hypothetical protein